MYNIEDIREVHLEISSLCNARCPECPRNYRGFPYNDGYPETNLTLDQVQQIFDPNFIGQIETLLINGNYGDFIMNEEAIEIVRYLRNNNANLTIFISTNGSARNKQFWQELATLKPTVLFDLDGLQDTHKLYRQNTSWHTIIQNAQTFIESGGNANWKMIEFKHNKHQINDCKKLSKKLGFTEFELIQHGRDQGPVYDKQGDLVHILGDWTHHWDGVDYKTVEPYITKRKGEMLLFDDIAKYFTPAKQINCEVKNTKSVYITANGEVYPCCYLGFYPLTNVGFGEQLEILNKQLRPLITNNNALEHPLSECIAWFNEIEKSWKCSTYKDGRLMKCDQQCGAK